MDIKILVKNGEVEIVLHERVKYGSSQRDATASLRVVPDEYVEQLITEIEGILEERYGELMGTEAKKQAAINYAVAINFGEE